jgi:hypothetical protein
MKQVYVSFHPILVDIPDNVAEALTRVESDNKFYTKEMAEVAVVEAAIESMSKVRDAKRMAMTMLDQVVVA